MNTFVSTQTSAAPVAAINQNTKPEWLRVPEAIRIFGVCRSSLYELIASGKIKSTALKKRGAVRGIRLISFDSLSEYIEQSANETEAS